MVSNADQEVDFFDDFDMQRVCIDRCQFIIYDKKYAMKGHSFDKELADFDLSLHMKRSKIGRRYVDVACFFNPSNVIGYEVRFDQSRAMLVRVNIIRLYNEENNIVVKDVLNEDNFFPLDIIVPLKEQVDLLYSVIEKAKVFYYDFVKKYWSYECEDIKVKLNVVEFPYEVYPGNVQQFKEELNGHKITTYDTQSQTIYFDNKKDVETNLIENVSNNVQVAVNRLRTESGKIQFKIYQKAFGLVRMEHTVYADDLKFLFSLKKHLSIVDSEQIILFLKGEFKKRGILPRRFTSDYDDALVYMSRVYGLSPITIDGLLKMSVWESRKTNRGMTQKLLRKGLIVKVSRGIYNINPHFKQYFESYPKRDVIVPDFL